MSVKLRNILFNYESAIGLFKIKIECSELFIISQMTKLVLIIFGRGRVL